MNPLMYGAFLPDGVQLSREAARRHALQEARPKPERVRRSVLRVWRPLAQA
jgi:hypothetical protein